MCEFCTKHGEGQKWYLLMKNYSNEMLHAELSLSQQAVTGTTTRLEWNQRFATNFVLRAAGIQLKPLKRRKSSALQPRPPKPSRQEVKREIPNRQQAVHFGQVLPIEDVDKTIDVADSITRMPCGCRYFLTGKENCRYCFGFAIDRLGMLGSYPESSASLEVMDKAEAKALIRQFDKEGLFHSVWTGVTPYIVGICNCDHDCGAYNEYIVRRSSPSFFRAEYICQINWNQCNGCKSCIRQCQFGAMFYSSALKKVRIDPARCFGCGVCRAACSKDAISLISREADPQAARIWLRK